MAVRMFKVDQCHGSVVEGECDQQNPPGFYHVEDRNSEQNGTDFERHSGRLTECTVDQIFSHAASLSAPGSIRRCSHCTKTKVTFRVQSWWSRDRPDNALATDNLR